jgi:hypothetical protein
MLAISGRAAQKIERFLVSATRRARLSDRSEVLVFDDNEVQIRDLQATLELAFDERLRVEKRLGRVLHFFEDHERALAKIKIEVDDTMIAGGRW